jgi:DNA invertase Pin-like site-specific DNA recombinase
MGGSVKFQTITYKPGERHEQTPCIRIANKLLKKYGFEIGDKVEVVYQRNKLTINKIKLMQNNKEVRIALYLRSSAQKIKLENNHNAISFQEEKGREFCKSQKGYTLKNEHIFKDEGFSGALSVEERPALKMLLEAAKNHEFDTVVIYKLDKLAENMKVLPTILKSLDASGVDLRSITEPLGTTPGALLHMVEFFIETEKYLIKKRIRDGINYKKYAIKRA